MREIWFMQARFERVNAKAIWRMIEQPRFRAAVDFLQLRAEAREVDSVQAQWWMDVANADHATRGEMIENHQIQQRGNRTAGTKRRRRPRKRPATQAVNRSEEHTSELQSLMRISYAVFCLKKKKNKETRNN